MDDFNGKRALVTGASSGIGRTTACLLAGRGAQVLATGRNEVALAPPPDVTDIKARWLPIAGDLTDAGFRKTVIERAADRMGGLDVLVNAAGILLTGSAASTGLDLWDRTMDINLRAVYDLCRLATPLLQDSKGSIVNVSSVAGTRAFPGVVAYCVSKAAVDQLTRCLALELASDGVRVNAVNPGVVRTELHRRGGMDAASYQAFLERSGTTHPLGRIGTPEEVAELILFLASSRAAWVTGDTIAIDGGRAQTCAR